ncbi:hypothetical protein A2924_03705 [Candidatus Giovannonibacteria bacterium RIFCSPLOWO2_01_FULL_44_16]|uniref:VWFA domain-containing protein n=1 Tax=Candidatus Giovannonibacteria bacterium RIFCSPLOWO2_01_FULL_44_16 TaxID=1798348 RepID=A0A1F5X2E3_9BACT|nr:MAG: hypothetical protein A2924_03705 [Candidatus Giovannonibacteria bacterium RIFCSPLOWO2_01_FULL_44_16]
MEVINSYFEAPTFLLMIPALFFLIFIGKRKNKISASSDILFLLAEATKLRRFFNRIMFILPKLLILAGLSVLVMALAEPRSSETKTVRRVLRGRIAIMVDDVSGSMTVDKRLEVLKKANIAFLDAFCKKEESKDGLSQNFIGIVSFSNDADIRMTPTRDCDIVRRRIKALEIENSTAIEKGLWRGLALLIEWVDHGRLIPDDELQRVRASLYERQLRIPKNSTEFCSRYKGLSLLLFTDGEFDQPFQSRESALLMSRDKQNLSAINPFNVIDLAKSLCVRTYFWSMENLPQSYKDAFSSPPGSGFAVQVKEMSKDSLLRSYAEVAEREAGEMVTEQIAEWNPLRRYFITIGSVCFLLGLLIFWSKNYSHQEGRV